ncbi:MAG: hypothetical protein JWO91_289 [Acidobacteriaceae bacterium]|nr:hypothetical protein [Acidobacteriaceae bacterium]
MRDQLQAKSLKLAPSVPAAALALCLCVLLLTTSSAQASDYSGQLTEAFHQSYPLSAGGRVELDNINGPVHVTGWDRNEVKVDAIKYARNKERLDEAKIEVDANRESISIHTRYPDHDTTFNSGNWNNPASVEYTLSVPRNARLDEIQLVNGSLDIQGVAAEVHASCVNGHLSARNLGGRAELSTVNGRMEATFDRLENSPVELSSVNGGVELTLPSDAKAEIEASTVSGGINNDFGLHVNNHQFVGHSLRGELGSGGTRIKLSDVNGRIEIRHANDGRTLSSAKDLDRGNPDDDRDDNDEI